MIGLYTSASRLRGADAAAALLRAEELGFRELWIANVGSDLDVVDAALTATSAVRVGTAVASIWSVPAQELAAWWSGRERLVLGIGISHGPLVGAAYERPLTAMTRYLDDLDAAGVPASARVLGANGPKMLSLAAQRSAGALTYLVTPEQTEVHRTQLGDAARLVPEVKLVLDDDGRRTAREHLAVYLGLPNYLGNLRRMGFTDDDLTPPGSDRLVDALVATGIQQVQRRVAEHRAAGADAVALHVLGTTSLPVQAWQALSEALLSGAT
ncbi:MAG: TIGR03620 family F420-dependent LLM class oxidoreductase [Mycobacteriales bacterium]